MLWVPAKRDIFPSSSSSSVITIDHVCIVFFSRSIRSLLEDEVTKATDKDIGLIATSIGLCFSFFLALYKYEVGNQLQSLTILAGDH